MCVSICACSLQRQAGRYLPEFRELRKTADFFTMCQTPHLATELTLQPLRRYKGILDAVVIFSDILIVPQVGRRQAGGGVLERSRPTLSPRPLGDGPRGPHGPGQGPVLPRAAREPRGHGRAPLLRPRRRPAAALPLRRDHAHAPRGRRRPRRASRRRRRPAPSCRPPQPPPAAPAQVPVLGFCGAPWTLMGYMVEGGGSKTYEKAKGWLYKARGRRQRG